MLKTEYNPDESFIIKATCKICNVKLPKMSIRLFESFVCVCQRNLTNPSCFAREAVDAGCVFNPITGAAKN